MCPKKSFCFYNIHIELVRKGEENFFKVLLRSLQVQTLPDATPPTGVIQLFSKIAVTFEPVMQFGYPPKI